MTHLFGTDGIRGEAGKYPLDKKTIAIIGKSLAKQMSDHLGRKPKIIIGRDTRESGGWIENAFVAGALSAGAVCETAEIITTPGIAFLTKQFQFDAGIVISASHNPFRDNGIKIFLPSGKKLDEKTEKRIENDIKGYAGDNFEDSAFCGVPAHSADFGQNYLDYLTGEFAGLSLSGLKIVVDCANGAASNLAPRLFSAFGAEIVVINNSPDGRNINKDCGSLHIGNLQRKVLEVAADFGVAFDGDADRSLFVDENGKFVDGDGVLWIMARHLRSTGELDNDTVVATVMSNIGLQIALNSENITLARTPVGDKYVLRELLETGSAIGGEQSGHIIFPRKSLVGDGMFTALYLLEAMSSNDKSLSELTAGFRQFPQILKNVPVREKRPFAEVPEIMDAAEKVENELGETGRLLLRYSGTENLARVMIEGEAQDKIDQMAASLAGVIKNNLG